MSWYLCLLSFLLFSSAQAQEISSVEKEESLLSFKMMDLENKISILNYSLSSRSQATPYSFHKTLNQKIDRAKSHLLSGEYQAAYKEARQYEKKISPDNVKLKIKNEKILFESARLQGLVKEASEICLSKLSQDKVFQNLWDDKWKVLCSRVFFTRSLQERSSEFRKEVSLWSASEVAKGTTQMRLLGDIYTALAMGKSKEQRQRASEYLQNSILTSKKLNPYLSKAYLVLALLKYQVGEKNKALSMVQSLAMGSSIKNNFTPYFEVDDKIKLWSKLTLARMNMSLGNLEESKRWYDLWFNSKRGLKTKLLTSQVYLEYAQLKTFLKSDKETDETHFIHAEKIISDDLNLLSQSKGDLKNNQSDLHSKILPVASLAVDYGVNTNESLFFIQKLIEVHFLSQTAENLRRNFVNVLNPLDVPEDGVSESVVLKSMENIDKQFLIIKNIVFRLDSLTQSFLSQKTRENEVSQGYRMDLLSRFDWADAKLAASLSQDNVLFLKSERLHDLKNKLNLSREQKSKLSSLVFLCSIANDALCESTLPHALIRQKQIEDKEIEALFESRVAYLNQEIFPESFYRLGKKYDVYSDSLIRLFHLEMEMIQNDPEYRSKISKYPNLFIETDWKNLLSLNQKNNELLQLCINKINEHRKKNQNLVSNLIKRMKELDIKKDSIQEDIFQKVKSNYPVLISQIESKIKEYQGMIDLSKVELLKDQYEKNKEKRIEFEKEKAIKERWMQSLQKKWELESTL
jgi:hypothetical protein